MASWSSWLIFLGFLDWEMNWVWERNGDFWWWKRPRVGGKGNEFKRGRPGKSPLLVVYSYLLFWVAIPMFENREKPFSKKNKKIERNLFTELFTEAVQSKLSISAINDWDLFLILTGYNWFSIRTVHKHFERARLDSVTSFLRKAS